MRKLITILAFLTAAASMPSTLRAASPAATQEWVRQYLATNAAYLASTTTSTTSNGVISASAGEGDNKVEVRIEEFGDAALLVTNSQTAVANGTRFVWNGRGSYICHSGVIVSTSTNLMWGSVGSFETNGVIRFDGVFDVLPILIQKSTSFSITNGMSFVTYEPSWSDRIVSALTSLLVPAARADIPSSAEEWYTPTGNWKKDLTSEIALNVYDAKNKDWELVSLPMSYDDSGEPYLANETIIAAFDRLQANVSSAMYAVGAAIGGMVEVETEVVWNRAAIEKIGENLNQLVGIHDVKTKDEDGKTRTIRLSVGNGGISMTGLKRTDEYDVQKSANTYSLTKNGATVGESWTSGLDADGRSIGQTGGSETKLQLFGWSSASGTGQTLAQLLKSGDRENLILYRDASGVLEYLIIGELGIGSPGVDNVTITTNASDHVGEAALVGFHENAENGSVPFANGSTLSWTGMSSAGALLAAGEDANPKWSTTANSGQYYGTPNNDAGGNQTPGWHSLPNVTTNVIQADDVTLCEDNQEGVKTIKMKPSEDGKLHVWGDAGWEVLNIPTGEVANVSVDDTTIHTNDENQLELVGLDKSSDGGKVPKWNGSSLEWFNLSDLLDNSSLEAQTESGGGVKSGGIGIKGWESAEECEAILSKMMTDANDSVNRNAHKLLAKHSDGSLHYVPLGDVIRAAGECTFTGTDGSKATGTNVVFTGSNCDVTVSGSGGTVTIQIEAYFR